MRPRDVVLLKTTRDTVEHLLDVGTQLVQETGCVVVLLGRDDTLELADEDEMRRHGWVRMT